MERSRCVSESAAFPGAFPGLPLTGLIRPAQKTFTGHHRFIRRQPDLQNGTASSLYPSTASTTISPTPPADARGSFCNPTYYLRFNHIALSLRLRCLCMALIFLQVYNLYTSIYQSVCFLDYNHRHFRGNLKLLYIDY